MMGTNIYGWVEVRSLYVEEPLWMAVLQIWPLLERNYLMFGSLFGVRNLAGFRPVAPERGIPADASTEVKQEFTADQAEYPAQSHWPSWISWQEIKAIDWEERTV